MRLFFARAGGPNEIPPRGQGEGEEGPETFRGGRPTRGRPAVTQNPPRRTRAPKVPKKNKKEAENSPLAATLSTITLPISERSAAPERATTPRMPEETTPQGVWSVIVNGLNPHITQNDLDAKFGQFENFISSSIPFDDSGFSKQYGFVNFRDWHSAHRAHLALNESFIEGCKVSVTVCTRAPYPWNAPQLPAPTGSLKVGAWVAERRDSSGFMTAFGPE
jgi:hypothetical protein